MCPMPFAINRIPQGKPTGDLLDQILTRPGRMLGFLMHLRSQAQNAQPPPNAPFKAMTQGLTSRLL